MYVVLRPSSVMSASRVSGTGTRRATPTLRASLRPRVYATVVFPREATRVTSTQTGEVSVLPSPKTGHLLSSEISVLTVYVRVQLTDEFFSNSSAPSRRHVFGPLLRNRSKTPPLKIVGTRSLFLSFVCVLSYFYFFSHPFYVSSVL